MLVRGDIHFYNKYKHACSKTENTQSDRIAMNNCPYKGVSITSRIYLNQTRNHDRALYKPNANVPTFMLNCDLINIIYFNIITCPPCPPPPPRPGRMLESRNYSGCFFCPWRPKAPFFRFFGPSGRRPEMMIFWHRTKTSKIR